MKINNELFEGNYLRKVTKIFENRKKCPENTSRYQVLKLALLNGKKK